MVFSDLDFAVRYPFTNIAKELLKKNQVKITERLAELAVERILDAVNNLSRKTMAIHESEKLEEIASYAAARMLLSYLRNSYLINKFAISESKRVSSYLARASSEELSIIAKELGVPASKQEEGFTVSLPVYLKFSPKSIEYRLVNRDVEAGQVRIKYREWIRLVEEAVRIHIEQIPKIKEVKPEIKNAAKQLLMKLPRVKTTYSLDRNVNPPCIEALLEDVRQHRNLPHQARWYLTVFLIKKGASDEDLVKIFSLLPDYNEKITRYQISHARKQNYNVPNCATVLSYGLCRASCGIKNPLEWKQKQQRDTKKGVDFTR